MSDIYDFLACRTSESWLERVSENLPLLLIDHANCEKKAASTALALTYQYTGKPNILVKLSRLAREEMHHFEQVVTILSDRKIPYSHLSPSRYAGELQKIKRHNEPGRFIDMLLIGALIEARSCERFEAIASIVDKSLSRFYLSLVRSESRHCYEYLDLAETEASYSEINERLDFMKIIERDLIESDDPSFRFHSGKPQ